MTLDEIKVEVQKYVYMENTSMIDASLATIIANRSQCGNPVWLVIVGASSGGKSQILKPLSLTDKKYMHRVDDITESTFLSGAKVGKDKETSLLLRIGAQGMLVISDLTVLFSRNVESRNAVLSQLRMIYDGEMHKAVGNSDKALSWKGHIGVIAGSTPTIYRHMEEVADMGERFMYWRMHDYDEREATRVAMKRTMHGKELDEHLAGLYEGYIRDIVRSGAKPNITDEEMEKIIDISVLAEKMRTVVRPDRYSKQVERLPCTAFPMRTALQLRHIGESLSIMYGGNLGDNGMQILRWLGWSLANEEKRKCLELLVAQTAPVVTQAVADYVGLDTTATRGILQAMSSVGLLVRTGTGEGFAWSVKDYKDTALIIETLEGKKAPEIIKQRAMAQEEVEINVDDIPF